ncbi:MAG: sugar phosphate nucleotidyltransferase [Candidatus Omnitrophota bacterium]
MENQRINEIQVAEAETVKAAMKQMDRVGLKILFVVDSEKKFKGTITDGDFRRWILKGNSIDTDISEVFQRNPIVFREKYDEEKVKEILVKERIEAVPIVDKTGKLVDVLFWEDLFGEKCRITTKKLDAPVVIMAGGMGARFSTVTKILPKPLIPFGEKPVAEVIMDNFAIFGCRKFFLLLGYKGGMIQSYFDNADMGYCLVYKFEDKPSGTAGALRLLKDELVADSFFVSNCDIVIKADYADIYDFHIKNRCDITIVSAMRHFVVPYGVMEMTAGGDMKALTEKPEYDFLVNTGMYLVNKNVLSLVSDEGEFHFTDLIRKAQESKGKVSLYPVSEKSWFDIGQPHLWEENERFLSEDYKEVKKRGGLW